MGLVFPHKRSRPTAASKSPPKGRTAADEKERAIRSELREVARRPRPRRGHRLLRRALPCPRCRAGITAAGSTSSSKRSWQVSHHQRQVFQRQTFFQDPRTFEQGVQQDWSAVPSPGAWARPPYPAVGRTLRRRSAAAFVSLRVGRGRPQLPFLRSGVRRRRRRSGAAGRFCVLDS